jgi:hypothetical protein
MNAGRWIGALIAVLVADIAIALLLAVIRSAENCGDCNDSLGDALDVALIALPALYFVLLARAVMRHRAERRGDGTPN